MLKKLLLIILFMLYVNMAYAYTIDNLADAIFKAEGGTRYGYGINRKYCKYKNLVEARQICINTIKHALRDWNGQGDFIVFLGSRYSPPDINPYWVKNVKYFLMKGGQNK